jgi:hypothetical protein
MLPLAGAAAGAAALSVHSAPLLSVQQALSLTAPGLPLFFVVLLSLLQATMKTIPQQANTLIAFVIFIDQTPERICSVGHAARRGLERYTK